MCSELQVDKIIGKRLTKDGKEDYLVHWQNFSPVFSTWEPLGNVFDCQGAIKEFYDQHLPIPGIYHSYDWIKFVVHCEFWFHQVLDANAELALKLTTVLYLHLV